jgi:hypothetical protein
MTSPTKSYCVPEVPTNRLIAAREDVRTLKVLCTAAALALLIPGSDDLTKEFVKLGDADFQKRFKLENYSDNPQSQAEPKYDLLFATTHQD